MHRRRLIMIVCVANVTAVLAPAVTVGQTA